MAPAAPETNLKMPENLGQFTEEPAKKKHRRSYKESTNDARGSSVVYSDLTSPVSLKRAIETVAVVYSNPSHCPKYLENKEEPITNDPNDDIEPSKASLSREQLFHSL